MSDNEKINSSTGNKKITNYEKLKVPGSIQIGKYTYIFKEQLKSDPNKFSYRCKKFCCRIPITINRENLKKINDPKNTLEIEYILKKNHKCETSDEKKIEIPDKCSTEEDLLNNAKIIIKQNPLESLGYQKIKLEGNNIYISEDKIKRLLYQIRNELYIKDEELLKFINHITITFDKTIENSRNIPFVPVYDKFINVNKGNRQESFIIVTSYFNLKSFTNASNIFIDATFKVAPKDFYQILNILTQDKDTKFIMPAAHIIMSNKSYYSYKKVFMEIKNLLNLYCIKYDFKDTIINCDFEKSLINSIREEFIDIKIYGCYFHYIKALWQKARNLNLTKKKFLENTKLLIFSLKIYPFILSDKKDNYIKEIYEFSNSLDNAYKKFIKYFKKNWENSKFLEFDLLPNGDIFNRTNNLVESFHHKLNNSIEYNHPRLSILLDKLKIFSIDYYHKFVSKLFTENTEMNNASNVFNDIYNFLRSFLKKYNYNINIKLLLQDEGKTKNDLEKITIKILNLFYNVKINNEEENNDNEATNKINSDNIIDNFDDLSDNWYNDCKKDVTNIEKISFKKDDDNEPSFNIDYEPYRRKRKYIDIKDNLIKNLYDKNNEIKDENPKSSKTLKIC